MNIIPIQTMQSPWVQSELALLRQRAGELTEAAEHDDIAETFPERAVTILRDAGCLQAVLPPQCGGIGLGWMPSATNRLFDLLRAIGGVHLSAARLFEGHVNAFQLLWLYGDFDQRDAVYSYVQDGHLLGVWNAPAPSGPLTLSSGETGALRLTGSKAYASGAGGIRRPLVTAQHVERGLVMVWPDAAYQVGGAEEWSMQGMRASYTRSVHFDCLVSESQLFGADNDYHRQPYFSGGSWRFLAAQLGAAEALVELMRQELVRRNRHHDTHQKTRMAQCVVALNTAKKWIRDAAHCMDATGVRIERMVAHANEARIVVERALLDVLEHVQRGVGLQSFSRHSPIERIARDLATYLRQPAPDALLDAVGEAAFARALPGLLAADYECH